MGCPICGRVYCDHSPAERGQSQAEMMADAYSVLPVEGAKNSKPSRKKAAKKVVRRKK